MKKELSDNLFINRSGNLAVTYPNFLGEYGKEIIDGVVISHELNFITRPGPLDILIKLDGWKDVYFTTLKNS